MCDRSLNLSMLVYAMNSGATRAWLSRWGVLRVQWMRWTLALCAVGLFPWDFCSFCRLGSESERWLSAGPPPFLLEWAAASWKEGDGLQLQCQLQDQSFAARPRIQLYWCMHSSVSWNLTEQSLDRAGSRLSKIQIVPYLIISAARIWIFFGWN
jgi:hypothetical protein